MRPTRRLLVSFGSIARAVMFFAFCVMALPSCRAQRQWSGQAGFQLSQLSATQSQQMYGGQLSVSNEVRKKSYCDSSGWTSDVDLAGSHTLISQTGTPSIALDNDDGVVRLTRWVQPRTSIGSKVEVFLNNSLGIGLEQIYALGVNHLVVCQEPGPRKYWHRFSVFADGRYVRERLYHAPTSLNLGGVSAGEEYQVRRSKLDSNGKRKGTLFRISETAQVIPMVNEVSALQAYADVKLSLPLAIEAFTFSVDEQEHYFGNAPHGFDKHYQQTTVSISYSFGAQ